MSADLKVMAVSPPPGPLRAPCPVVVVVRIRNDGSDTASPVDFDVTIDLGVTDMPGATFETIVTDPEDMALSPGREIDVPVLVEFPCTSPVMLRATVDLKHRIPNNDRTAPSMTLTGLVTTPVPWLTVTLRLGIRDAAGVVTFDPDVLCPGKFVVADIVIENKGCVPSKASKTDVTLEDANAVPSPVALTNRKYLVPALPPSGSHHTSLSFPTPTLPATTSGALAVRVCADTSVANPDQCDRTHLDVRIVKPFSAGGPPQLTLTGQGGGSIRPGEVPTVSWSVRNECSEIGTADVKILFGMPPTELYRTQQMIPLGSTVGEDVALTIAPTIANAFWTFGVKDLELEISGNGPEGGPYSATGQLTVIPEAIDATWWRWGTAPTGSWKSSYVVAGSFTNRGFAGQTFTALSAVEHPTDVTGTTQDVTVTPSVSPIGQFIAPNGSLGATWLRRQSWTWLALATALEVGPRSRTFSYVGNYALIDAFGNVYPALTTYESLVTVSVSSAKIRLRDGGRDLILAGLGFLAAAAVALATLPYPINAVLGAFIAACGMALIIWGTLSLYSANDPPVPDFREYGPVRVDPRAWTIPEPDDDSLHALHTVALLVARAVSARVRAVRYRDLAWAAYVDGDQSRQVGYRDDARSALETLRRLTGATIDAADEANETFERILNELREPPTLDDIREIVGRFEDDFGLNDEERTLIDERLASVDEQQLQQSLDLVRSNGIRLIGQYVKTIHETTAAEFAEREYLR
jgi:hypothetical protein